MIDEIPVLAVAAAFAEGVTEFRDAAELRVKESDRIATVERAAHAASASGSEPGADRLVVRGRPPAAGRGRRATATTASPWPAAVAAGAIDGRDEGAGLALRSPRRTPSSPPTSPRSPETARDAA